MQLMRSELVMHQMQKTHMHTQGEKGRREEEEAAVDGHQCPDMDERGEEGEKELAQAKEVKVGSRMWTKGQGPMMFLDPMMLVKLARV